MKQILIPENLFNKILKGCKGSVEKGGFRPELQFIRIEVAKQSITAYSLDGYRASRVVLPLKEEAEEEFTAYIMPFAFKEIGSGKENVLLGVCEEGAFVDFKTFQGRTRLTFSKPQEWTCDIKKEFEDAKQHDREVGVNTKYLADACKAIGSIVEERYKLAILENSSNPTKAFCLRAKGEDFVIDQLILPVRVC